MTNKDKLQKIKRMIENKDYADSDNNLDWIIQLEKLLDNIVELIDEK